MDTPAIASLDIFAQISGRSVPLTLGLFPDDRLPKRLLNLPIFKIGTMNTCANRMNSSSAVSKYGLNRTGTWMRVETLSWSASHQFHHLRLLSKQTSRNWTNRYGRIFPIAATVRSVGCHEYYGARSNDKPLWNVLSPTQGGDPASLYPNLESIRFKVFSENGADVVARLPSGLQQRWVQAQAPQYQRQWQPGGGL